MPVPPSVLPEKDILRRTTARSRLAAAFADVSFSTPEPEIGIPQLRPPLSQGNTGACVGFSFTNWLNTDSPRPFYGLKDDFAIDLWQWAKKHDKDPSTHQGNPDHGTYPWYAAVRLKKLGYVTSIDPWGLLYEKDLRKHILTVGPSVIAMAWWSGFDNPEQGTETRGLIKRSGVIRGGHAILCFWFDKKTKRYWLYQTWKGYGPYDKYGQIVEVSAKDMKYLLNNGGYGMVMEKNPNKQT